MIKSAQLREFVEDLRRGSSATAPSPELVEFTQSARRLGPRGLIDDAKALIEHGEDSAAVAQVVAASLKGLLGDIDEHGAQSEFGDDAAFVKKALKAWLEKAGPALASDVLRERGLEAALVAEVEFFALPGPQAREWAKLRKARNLTVPLTKLVKKQLAPWFAELVAAYVGRELHEIGKTSRQEAWQSKLADVPALVSALHALSAPLFGQRAMAEAKFIAQRHHPTREMLERLGGRSKKRSEVD